MPKHGDACSVCGRKMWYPERLAGRNAKHPDGSVIVLDGRVCRVCLASEGYEPTDALPTCTVCGRTLGEYGCPDDSDEHEERAYAQTHGTHEEGS